MQLCCRINLHYFCYTWVDRLNFIGSTYCVYIGMKRKKCFPRSCLVFSAALLSRLKQSESNNRLVTYILTWVMNYVMCTRYLCIQPVLPVLATGPRPPVLASRLPASESRLPASGLRCLARVRSCASCWLNINCSTYLYLAPSWVVGQ